MYFNAKLFDVLDTDTNIKWWNENRSRVNEAITLCNTWQIYYRKERAVAEKVLAKVDEIKEWSDSRDDGCLNDWQIEILDEIEKHVKDVLENEEE